ncbi:AAA family ATPase [Streptomyces sp. MNU76]|uniref:helix-turn-helix transcriptional regulator n=1 Tax=Streptomyces sp. MNU76 TaxID=2560026 RepID=UPI001E37BAA4|nr:LuxR family transcriptional regulator [Streptomyces sp. MNU76]MCC9705413.1 AAA family ATPase [Streptomyces sp. MNU76]
MVVKNAGPAVGRDTELGLLREALRATASGSGRCLVVEGPPGIGKSRLLQEAAREAERLGMTFALGRATELDRVAPLAVLLSALRDSVPPVVDRADMSALRGLGSQEADRFWLVSRLGDLIEEHARTRPLVIALDDAQSMDELTAFTLQILVPRLRACSVQWLLARRSPSAQESRYDVVGRLLQDGAEHVVLGRLDPDAIVQLCSHVLGAAPSPDLAALAARSDGNPFLLEQLLNALEDDDRLLRVDGMVEVVGNDALPDDFLSAVDYQLRHLSAPTRRLLEAGSVFGRPFLPSEAAGLLGERGFALLPRVEEAVEAHVLVDDGTALAFRHDLIREAVYDSLTGSVRRILHQEAATVLEAAGSPRAETALHLIRGASRDNPHTIDVLCAAADEVAPTSPSTAADLVLEALGLLSADDPEAPGLIARAVSLLASSGRITEARDLGAEALHRNISRAQEASVYVGLAEALKHAGQDAMAVEYTRRALTRPGVPDAVRGQLLAVQSHALLNGDDVRGAEASAIEAMAVGEPDTVVYAGAALSVAARILGRVDEAISLASDAVQLADDTGGDARHRHPRLWLGRALVAADRFGEADAVLELGENDTRALGSAWSLPLWHYGRAELRLMAGQLSDAQAEALAGKAVAEQLSALAIVPSLLTILGQVAIHRDELVRARKLFTEAHRMAESGYGVVPEDIAWLQAQLAYAEGNPQAAVTALSGVYERLDERPLLLTQVAWAAPALVRFALDAGASEEARAAAVAARKLADDTPKTLSLAAAAHHAEGLLADDVAMLHAAVDAYRAGPRHLARAIALEDAAHAETRAGRRGRAVALLEEALGRFTDCGATRSMARVQRALRGLGVRRKKWQSAQRAQTGWDSLTGAELRVVRLVAEGLTNRAAAERLFLSPHTVDTHLRHAFAKLGVSSRVELARQAMLHDGGGEGTTA